MVEAGILVELSDLENSALVVVLKVAGHTMELTKSLELLALPPPTAWLPSMLSSKRIGIA